MRPVIGISCSQNKADKSFYLWEAYVRAINYAKGIPVILPVIEEHGLIEQYVKMLDGLLLSGGVDIDSVNYGEEPLTGFTRGWPITPERDQFEIALTRAFMQADKPVLGICRGHQLINVAAGGSLYQDVSFQESALKLCHFQEAPWSHPTHKVELVTGTKLYDMYNQSSIRVNSMHHQVVKHIAPGYAANATAADNIIEGIESTRNKFIVGVQWHPELLLEKDNNWIKLFSSFVEAC